MAVDYGQLASLYGATPDYFRKTAMIESGGNPQAFNKGSKASGLYQFIPSTWAQYSNGGDVFDPQANADAMGRFTKNNAETFKSSFGRDPTEAELYGMHQQGAGGYMKLLQNPTARAADLVGLSAVTGNGGTSDMTAQQFADMWKQKYDKTGGGGGADLPMQGAEPTSGPSGGLFQNALGDGALFGGTPETSFGDRLIQAGAAAMARDNPQGAAALLAGQKGNGAEERMRRTEMVLRARQMQNNDAAQRRADEFAQKQQNWEIENRQKQEAATQKLEADRLKNIQTQNPKIIQAYGEQETFLDKGQQNLNELDQVLKDIDDGVLKVEPLERMKAGIESLTGKDDPASIKQREALNRYTHYIENSTNDLLNAAKGPQSEGDYARIFRNQQPGMSGWNTDEAKANLRQLRKGVVSSMGSALKFNERLSTQFPGNFDPETGVKVYRKNYDERSKRYDDEEKAANAPKPPVPQVRSLSEAPPGATEVQVLQPDGTYKTFRKGPKPQ